MKQKNTEKPNIVMIVLDAARSDFFSCYGFPKKTTPFIDKIAKEGILFENAYTTSSWTIPSHFSFFTGNYPEVEKLQNKKFRLFNTKESFAEDLKKNGYTPVSFCSNELLRFLKIMKGFVYEGDGGFLRKMVDKYSVQEKYYYNMKKEFFQFLLQRRIKQAIFNLKIMSKKALFMFFRYLTISMRSSILSAIKLVKKDEIKNPFFIFINSMHTHIRYKYKRRNFKNLGFKNYFFKRFSKRFNSNIVRKRVSNSENVSNEIEIVKEKYLSSINYSDELVYGLYKLLEKKGILDNTILIITADHGEEFLEHGFVEHASSLYNPIIKIPLIIRFPKRFGIKGRRKELISSIDLFPSLFSLIGLKTGKHDGINIFSEKREHCFAEHLKVNNRPDLKSRNSSMCVIFGDYKYIWNSDYKEELFNLKKDTKEENNLASTEKEKASKMKKLLFEWKNRKKQRSDVSEVSDKKKKEIKSALKQMGYM
jgi:arylsulfatase A-like enzyme